MKKKLLSLMVLPCFLIFNLRANAQCQTVVSIPTNGTVQVSEGNLSGNVTIAGPVGTVINLPDATPGSSPVQINFPDPTSAIVSIPNSGGNEIRFPITPGFIISTSNEGIIITVPQGKAPLPIKLNMRVLLTINGQKQVASATMDPLPMTGNFPKGAKLVIRYNPGIKQEEIKVTGEQVTIKAGSTTPMRTINNNLP